MDDNGLISLKNYVDMLGCDYHTKDDLKVCNYVIDNIPNFNFISYCGKRISKKHAIKKSLDMFNMFGDKNYQRLCDIINNVKFYRDYPSYRAAVTTSCQVNINQNISSHVCVSAYHIPKKLHDIDIVFLGHEHCHALKESNFQEHKKRLILGEVIPIFYELINYDADFLKEKALLFRLYWLNNQKYDYLSLNDKFNNTPLVNSEEKKRYEFERDNYASYLGAFYYSLVLYSMYKENPVKILKFVSNVLNHKTTTYQMLKQLNLYCDIKGDIFEKELKNIIKVLRK